MGKAVTKIATKGFVNRLDRPTRRLVCREFVGKEVILEQRDTLGVHWFRGEVLSVAPLFHSGQTDAVLVIRDADGWDTAISLAQILSIRER